MGECECEWDSYIKDTNHALKTFRDFNFPGQNKLIFTIIGNLVSKETVCCVGGKVKH